MKNTDAMVIDTLKEVGALLEGHFLLSQIDIANVLNY